MLVDKALAVSQALFYLASNGAGSVGSLLSELSAPKLSDIVSVFDTTYRPGDEPILYVIEYEAAGRRGMVAIFARTEVGQVFAFAASDWTPFSERIKAVAATVSNRLIPVVYSYPKLGLGALDSEGFSHMLSIERRELAPLSDDPEEPQGDQFWSFLDNLPQGAGDDAKWVSKDRFIRQFTSGASAMPMAVKDGLTWDFTSSTLLSLAWANIAAAVGARLPSVEAVSLPVKMIGQSTSVFCAPTTLQMILAYLGDDVSQQDIAGTMATGLSGSALQGQLTGFRHYLDAHFSVSLDKTPTFAKVSSSLNAFLPVKVGSLGHARCAVGYRVERFVDPLSGTEDMITNILQLNDPIPVGVGAQTLVNFDAAGIRDLIVLKRL